MNFKLHSLRIRQDTGETSGMLWHYGHFIHDLIMPLADWLVENDHEAGSISLYIEDVYEQSVGTFLDMIHPLLGVTPHLLPSHEFELQPGEPLELDGYLFGPYASASFKNIQSLVEARFDLQPTEDPMPEIILIERSEARLGFEDREDIRAGLRMNGLQRRRIKNHAELTRLLQLRYGRRFRNVILEQMPIAEQVRLFYHVRIIIGQHGAGLNNLVWVKRDDATVIELGPTAIKTFENMCIARGFEYHALGPSGESFIRVEFESLEAALETADQHRRAEAV